MFVFHPTLIWTPLIEESVTDALPPASPTAEITAASRRIAPFLEALGAVVVASVLSYFLRDDLAATRLLLFWVASAYAAWRGGLWPTIVASLLGAVLANYTTTVPFGAFTPPSLSELFTTSDFVFVTGLLGATFDRLRRARA